MSEESLSGTHITIRINKPANLCVVVSRIEVVEARFGIVVVTAIAERVIRAESRSKRTGYGKNIAPRVVRIFYHDFARSIQDSENVVAEVLAEIVVFAAVSNAENAAVFVIEIRLNGSVSVFAYYLRAVKLARRSYAVDCLLLCKNLYNQNATPRKFLYNPNPFSAFFFFLFLIIFS